MHRTAIAYITLASTAFMAHADIVHVSEFESAQTEGFENLNFGKFERGDVAAYDDMGTVFNTSGSWVHSTGSWSFKQRVTAYEGEAMLGTASGVIGYRFQTQQQSFGGFFASISKEADGEIRFYSGEELIGSDSLVARTDSSWSWNGWSSDRAFNRVEVSSNHQNRGFLIHDAVRVLTTEVPAPGGSVLLLGGVLMIARRRR